MNVLLFSMILGRKLSIGHRMMKVNKQKLMKLVLILFLDNQIDESVGINVQFEGPSDDEIELSDDDISDLEDDIIDDNTQRINFNNNSNRTNQTLQSRTIDAFWLQRNLSKIYSDDTDIKLKTEEILNILKTSSDNHELENKLIMSLGSEQFEFIKILRTYRQMSKFQNN